MKKSTSKKSKRTQSKRKLTRKAVRKSPKIEMVPAARAEAAEYRRDVSAARVLELETFIANAQKTGILDYTAAEVALKGQLDGALGLHQQA